MMRPKFWIEPDWFYSRFYTVYKKYPWWPFKIEVGNGLMSLDQAKSVKFLLESQYE